MLITLCLNLGGLINGYGVAWPAPLLPKLQDPEQTPFSVHHSLSSSEQSWVVSVVYLGAPGAFLGGYWANNLGRKKTLIIGGVLNLLVHVFITFAKNLIMLYIGRALIGFSMSLLAVTELIYVGEIASSNIRGIILTSMCVFHALGGLLVYSIGPFVSYAGVGYVLIAINVVFVVACWFLPESSMFYVIKGNEEAARLTLQYLGRDVDVSSELTTMMEKFRAQQQQKHVWEELFTLKFNQYSLFITVCLVFFEESSGIVTILFFGTTIFKDAGSSVKPDIATIIIGAALVLGTCISPMYIEKYGRRVLLMVSTAGCSVFMVVLGVHFYLKIKEHPYIESLGLLPLISVVGAIFMHSVGLSTIPNTLSGELFTYKVRGLGASCALIGGWMSGLITNTVFGYVISVLGGHVAFWIFAAIDAIAFVFVVAFVPETKGKSLMEVQMVFENGRQKILIILLGVETLGPRGTEALRVFKKLFERLVEATCDPRAGQYLAQRISIAIQRGNAASVLGTLPTSIDMDQLSYL